MAFQSPEGDSCLCYLEALETAQKPILTFEFQSLLQPMIVLLACTYVGLRTLDLTRLFQQNVPRVKLLLALLFTGIAFMMGAYSLRAWEFVP